jgi:hypothetical protein
LRPDLKPKNIMNKRFLLLLAIIAFSSVAFSQPMGGGVMNWSPNGNSYTTLEKGKIVKVELPSMNKTTLVDVEKLFPKDSIHPRQLSSFHWSTKEAK